MRWEMETVRFPIAPNPNPKGCHDKMEETLVLSNGLSNNKMQCKVITLNSTVTFKH